MMHLRARHLIPHLLDGGLAPALARRVRAHASGCAACAGELAALQRAEELLRRLPVPLALDALDPGHEHRLRRLSRWGRRALPAAGPPRLGRAIAAITPLAAAAGVALAVLSGQPGPDSDLDTSEAFNFVLAGSFAEHRPEPTAGFPPRVLVTASNRPDESGRESYLLPIGVR